MNVGSAMGTSKTQDFVLLAALAIAGYVVYQVVKGVKTVAGAAGAAGAAVSHGVSTGYTATVDAVGSGLYKLFGPDDAKTLGSMTYFMVSFPDGSRHAVPANTVNNSGVFIWTGYPPNSQPNQSLMLVKDAAGRWYATSNTPIAMSPSQLQPVVFDPDALDVPAINFGRYR